MSHNFGLIIIVQDLSTVGSYDRICKVGYDIIIAFVLLCFHYLPYKYVDLTSENIYLIFLSYLLS